jgi:hypothetical protein
VVVLPTQQGQRPCVNVVIALETLLGLNEDPAWLNGYGPITPDIARQLAADPSGTWRAMLTDTHGSLIGYSATRYRPPANLRDFILARDPVDVFPSSNVASYRTELDHTIPYNHADPSAGGATSAANLKPVGKRFHHGKTDGHLQYCTNADGSTTWRLPSGHYYTNRPAQRWTTTTDTPHHAGTASTDSSTNDRDNSGHRNITGDLPHPGGPAPPNGAPPNDDDPPPF